MEVNYNAGANTNPETIKTKLNQDFNNISSKIDLASAGLVDVENRMTPIGYLEGILNPIHFGVQYNSMDDLKEIQETYKKDIDKLSKEKESKKKIIDDFEQVILGNKKYSEVLPDVYGETEYVIMRPDGKNRGYGDEKPGDLYLGKIENGKIWITSPAGEYREYNFSEGGNDGGGKYDRVKYNDDIFTRLVLDTADKYYEGWAKVNKGYNPQGVIQQALKKWNLTKGRRELSTPIQGETLYTKSGYNSYIQDIIKDEMKKL